jgi:hypothetical protein
MRGEPAAPVEVSGRREEQPTVSTLSRTTIAGDLLPSPIGEARTAALGITADPGGAGIPGVCARRTGKVVFKAPD